MQQLALGLPLFDASRLPKKPYCSDDINYGVVIRTLAIAIEKRFIQANRPGLQNYLTFDVDRPDAGAAWLDSNAPRPSFVIKNPDNGHAHYLYALEHPVCTTDAARTKPLIYLAAVEAAISRELRADPGYSGLIIKNPAHHHWQTIAVETTPYTLGNLARNLDVDLLPFKRPGITDAELWGLGRNCHTFELLRHWSYQAVQHHWRPGGETGWHHAVRDRAHELNLFANPLTSKEVDQIAKSVARWVWKRFSPQQLRALIERTHTPELQSKRGQMKGKALREAMLPEVMERLSSGQTVYAMAKDLGISKQTIGNWLKIANRE